MLSTLFGKLVFESKINDSAASKIENLIALCVKENSVPTFKAYKNASLKVQKKYIICNNCAWIKNSKFCTNCKTDTTSNHYTLFDVKHQAEKIVDSNMTVLNHFKNNIEDLGYLKSSFVSKFHSKNDGLSLTINMDGVSVFSNNSKDTWPVYLAFNELPNKSKFAINNIILAGIWCGQTKINNYIILDDTIKSIKSLESGINIHGNLVKIFVIYGSFDKPAKSLAYNAQSCTAKHGCMFCTSECTRLNKKPVFLKTGQIKTHSFQYTNSVKAAQQGKPYLGFKGISSLRY